METAGSDNEHQRSYVSLVWIIENLKKIRSGESDMVSELFHRLSWLYSRFFKKT